jgi:hypothetical protein
MALGGAYHRLYNLQFADDLQDPDAVQAAEA